MRRHRSRLLWCVLILSSVQISSAQSSTPRPRIGLVLSGGGARGLAHLGVMRWMDEHHIPVDYVAGTSMGALVGALYATGLDANERQKFIDSVDWDSILLTEPTYSQLSFRRKEDRRSHEVAARMGLKHGVGSPNGFSPGHETGFFLDRIGFAYSSVKSFDDLPIPFRCVATDMLKGTAVVRGDGSLSQALRATMAIPGVFSPVEWNNTILADGGLVNNIPTDVARDMGAQTIIAVNVGAPLGDAEELQSFAGVLLQSIFIMTLENDTRSLRRANVVVSPDLRGYSFLDFDRASIPIIIQRGYEAAEKDSANLLPFALNDDDWRQYVAAVQARRRMSPDKIAGVDVVGTSPSEEARLEKKLGKFAGNKLNSDQLETELTRAAGEGKFDRLAYVGYLRDDAPALRIVAHEKTYGPPFLDFAVNVNGSGVGNFDFAAGARVTFMDVHHWGGEWRNDLLLGSSSRAATELYQPLGGSHLFVAPYLFFDKLARNAFSGDQRIGVFRDERGGGGLDIGLASGRRSELRVGYQLFNGDLVPLIGSSGLSELNGSSGQLRLRFVYDGLDRPTVPGRGERVVLNVSRVFQSPGTVRPFSQLEARSSTFVAISAKTSIFVNASGGTTFHQDADVFHLFSLGGQFRLGAYLPDQFLGNHYAYAALGFRRDLYRLPTLVGKKVYWAGWMEAGSAFNSPDRVVGRGSINVGVIAETIVGPVSLGESVSPTGQTKVNFSIGRVF